MADGHSFAAPKGNKADREAGKVSSSSWGHLEGDLVGMLKVWRNYRKTSKALETRSWLTGDAATDAIAQRPQARPNYLEEAVSTVIKIHSATEKGDILLFMQSPSDFVKIAKDLLRLRPLDIRLIHGLLDVDEQVAAIASDGWMQAFDATLLMHI